MPLLQLGKEGLRDQCSASFLLVPLLGLIFDRQPLLTCLRLFSISFLPFLLSIAIPLSAAIMDHFFLNWIRLAAKIDALGVSLLLLNPKSSTS